MKIIRQALVLSCVMAAVLVFLPLRPASGGGPLVINAPTGRPFVWPNGGRGIVFRTDLGGLGPMSNAEAVAQTVAAFNEWEAVPTATVTFVNSGPLPVDVDETNFAPYLFGPPDGINPVIYDEDGAISDLLYGPGAAVLGFGGIDFANDLTGEIQEGIVFLNGGLIEYPNPLYPPTTAAEFLGIQVHEIGHFTGLAHSVVNGELIIGELFSGREHTGPSPYDTFPLPGPRWPPPGPLADKVETMYPLNIPGTGSATPDADDRAALSALYPEPGFFTDSGTITGRILGLNGKTPINGVNVIARNVADPFADAVSAISGFLATSDSPDDPLAGVYTLYGLTPGAQYAVYVDEILAGGFSTEPRFSLPGPEEFYNGADESNDPDTDLPHELTPLTAVAGSPLTGIDIIFNRLRPGTIPNDALQGETHYGWVELLLPFPFEIGGQTFDTVFLNALNGTLTFGEPDIDIVSGDRALRNHLLGPPRIAGLMVSGGPFIPYAPGPGGEVLSFGVLSFDETGDTFTVQYTNVPIIGTFGLSEPNTFSITLHAKKGGRGNLVTLSYGNVDVENAVVGYSGGSRVTSGFEQESDLSALAGRLVRGEGQAAIAEEFVNSDIDLHNRTLTFEMPGAFADRFEPNNSPSEARMVTLPFHTADTFADLSRGDVDYYRLRANAGELIVAETVPGSPLNTLIGLFGSDGTLLSRNDDIYPRSRFSRLIFRALADGEYMLAVTTSPDFNFTGAGAGAARYVLTINTYGGTILPLNGDDVAVELPLRFAFPFQGAEWNSVWVSSNGSLTFGAPEPAEEIEDFMMEGFLGGPPRIAPFFTDLDPSGTYNGRLKGLVIAEEKEDSLTVHYVSVPRILDRETNTFSVTLNWEGQVTMAWSSALSSDRDARGTIVGVTQGAGAVSMGPVDLSRVRNVSATGTTYEQFAAAFLIRGRRYTDASNVPSFDLSFKALKFVRVIDLMKRDDALFNDRLNTFGSAHEMRDGESTSQNN